MSFYESRFPVDVSLNCRGGPRWKTVVSVAQSGKEVRNVKWSNLRCEFEARYGVRTRTQLLAVVSFFNEMRGRAHGFRYKDWLDYEATNEVLTPDGTGTIQLIKTYGSGFNNYTRTIIKPVAGITMKLNGGSFTDFTLDTATGIVTFTASPVPQLGDALTWTGEFDVPCRFDTDVIDIDLTTADLADTSIPIVELKL